MSVNGAGSYLPAEEGATPRRWREPLLVEEFPFSTGQPAGEVFDAIADFRHRTELLAEARPLVDVTEVFSPLVGSAELLTAPVHRWFYYKEGFSPRLAPAVAKMLGAGDSNTIADVFSGVGTSLVSLAGSSRERVVGVEYSPLSHFITRTKLAAPTVKVRGLQSALRNVVAKADTPGPSIPVPGLHTFSKSDLFAPDALQQLLRIRDAVRASRTSDANRDLLELALIAVVEEASEVMRDGRALRRRRGRKRHRRTLTSTYPLRAALPTVRLFEEHVAGMIDDLTVGLEWKSQPEVVRGDARGLRDLKHGGTNTFAANETGLHVFSPPYLNFIDYSEVYKMELWLLEMVATTDEFRELRRGTLRSHPSLRFHTRDRQVLDCAGVALAEDLSEFVEAHGRRPNDGAVIREYFLDMAEVLSQVFWNLEPGGSFACVVANSTFTRRARTEDEEGPEWTLPIATDLILGDVAQSLGFEAVTVWKARDLRPRNVKDGSARESIVVGRKPW